MTFKTPKLEKRAKGLGIFRIGDDYKESLLKDIKIGGCVILKRNGLTITAEVIKKIGEREFRGIIKGFEPAGEIFEGLAIGDEISFYEENIKSYGCPSKGIIVPSEMSR